VRNFDQKKEKRKEKVVYWLPFGENSKILPKGRILTL